MSWLACRVPIARATFLGALFSLSPADAQVVTGPGQISEPDGLWRNLVTGTEFDIVNRKKAEQRLDYLEGKLRRDSQWGHPAAVSRDLFLIERDRYRIAVAGWLIQKNTLHEIGYYPVRTDALSAAVIREVARPQPVPGQVRPTPTLPTTAATRPVSVTIVNAQPSGDDLTFVINSITYQAAPGSRRNLTVLPDSTLTYDGGGSIGQRRYRLSGGVYEFRSTAEGVSFFRVPRTP